MQNRKVASLKKFMQNCTSDEETKNITQKLSKTPNKYVSPCLRDENASESRHIRELSSIL